MSHCLTCTCQVQHVWTPWTPELDRRPKTRNHGACTVWNQVTHLQCSDAAAWRRSIQRDVSQQHYGSVYYCQAHARENGLPALYVEGMPKFSTMEEADAWLEAHTRVRSGGR